MLGGKGYKYQDEVLQTAEFKNIQLSATGGTKSMRYFISGGYQGDEGIMLKSNFEKFNFRAKMDIELSKKAKLSFNLNPSYSTKQTPSDNLTDFWRYPSWLPAVHNEATAKFVRDQNTNYPNIQAGDYAHPRHFIDLLFKGEYPDGSPLIMPDNLPYSGLPITGSPSNSAQNNPMATILSKDINAKSSSTWFGFQNHGNFIHEV